VLDPTDGGAENLEQKRVGDFVAQYKVYDSPYFREADTLAEFEKREALLPVIEQIISCLKELIVETRGFLGFSNDHGLGMRGDRTRVMELFGDGDSGVSFGGTLCGSEYVSSFSFGTKKYLFELFFYLNGRPNVDMSIYSIPADFNFGERAKFTFGGGGDSLLLRVCGGFAYESVTLEAGKGFINDSACRTGGLQELDRIIGTIGPAATVGKAKYLAETRHRRALEERELTERVAGEKNRMRAVREELIASLGGTGVDEVVSGLADEVSDSSANVLVE